MLVGCNDLVLHISYFRHIVILILWLLYYSWTSLCPLPFLSAELPIGPSFTMTTYIVYRMYHFFPPPVNFCYPGPCPAVCPSYFFVANPRWQTTYDADTVVHCLVFLTSEKFEVLRRCMLQITSLYKEERKLKHCYLGLKKTRRLFLLQVTSSTSMPHRQVEVQDEKLGSRGYYRNDPLLSHKWRRMVGNNGSKYTNQY